VYAYITVNMCFTFITFQHCVRNLVRMVGDACLTV